MRCLVLLLFLLANGNAQVKETNPTSVMLSSSEKIVKGAPFSAVAVAESVQRMYDGNKIIRSTKAQLYRDSEGRFRRDEMPKPVGNGLFVETPQVIIILDTVAGIKFYLDPKTKTARQSEYKEAFKYREKELEKQKRESEKQKKELEKQKEEREKQQKNRTEPSRNNSPDKDDWKIKSDSQTNETRNSDSNENSNNGIKSENKTQSKEEKTEISSKTSIQLINGNEVKNESLGRKKFEGVEAEGTRTTTTIPAGAIGNERAFQIIYERWFSDYLQLYIYSNYSDPRFGEQTYQLTNIKLEEPDGALFKLPADYKLVNSIKEPIKPVFPKVAKPFNIDRKIFNFSERN